MQVGDKINISPSVTCSFCDEVKTEGIVEYIHPKKRFFVVRFFFDLGRSFCESFGFDEI